MTCTSHVFFRRFESEIASFARESELECEKKRKELFSLFPHPHPIQLAENKSLAVFISIGALDNIWREKRGPVNRLRWTLMSLSYLGRICRILFLGVLFCFILLLTLSKSLSVELNDGCVNNTSISPLEVAPDDIGKIDMWAIYHQRYNKLPLISSGLIGERSPARSACSIAPWVRKNGNL